MAKDNFIRNMLFILNVLVINQPNWKVVGNGVMVGQDPGMVPGWGVWRCTTRPPPPPFLHSFQPNTKLKANINTTLCMDQIIYLINDFTSENLIALDTALWPPYLLKLKQYLFLLITVLFFSLVIIKYQEMFSNKCRKNNRLNLVWIIPS